VGTLGSGCRRREDSPEWRNTAQQLLLQYPVEKALEPGRRCATRLRPRAVKVAEGETNGAAERNDLEPAARRRERLGRKSPERMEDFLSPVSRSNSRHSPLLCG